MNKSDFESEKDTIDFVTDAMHSLSFLDSISDIIFSKRGDMITVEEFYDNWLQDIGVEDRKVPCSLGSIVGYLFCGIILTKEKWYSLIPDIDISRLDSSWGLDSITLEAPKLQKPSVRKIIRRLRNALGHGNIKVNVPHNVSNKEQIYIQTTLEFSDVNQSDPNDTFYAVLSLDSLFKLIKQIHSIIHTDVTSRIKEPNKN